jgi:hypothetical protein
VTDAARILAAMIALQPPGQTTYSRVQVPHDAGPPCSEPTLLCAPPRLNPETGIWTVAESEELGRERYAMIAEAIEIETWRIGPKRRDRIRKLVVTVFRHESGFREDVQTGRARGDEGRSWGLGQILLGARGTVFGFHGVDLVGDDLDAMRRCARVTVKLLDRGDRFCRGDVVCTLAQYGGAPPQHPQIQRRAFTYRRISL